MIIDRLVKFAKDIKFQDTEVMLDLMCAKGREEFYLRICGREGRGDGSGADPYCPDAQHCGRRSG